MKRSTLTLSILTALLVSACGGSSSNDEQTKDPTPPKVTPTKPTTPSTGNTSTTGNKDNAGTSGSSAGSSASSSSSDPTPPISSGSAPSGGKPIVIEAKEEEKTPGGEELTDPPVDPLKESLEKAKQEQKAIDEQKADKERRLKELEGISSSSNNGEVHIKWSAQDEMRKELLKGLGFTGNDDLKNLGIETIKQKIASDPQYADKSDDLKKYEELRADWLKSKAEMLKLRGEVQELGQQSVDKRKEVSGLKSKQEIENAEVKSERDYLTKKEQKDQFDLDKEKAEAESKDIETNLAQNKLEKGILEKQQKDLEKAIALAKASKKDHADLDAQLTQVEANLEQNEKDKTELTSKQETATKAKEAAVANSDSIKNVVKNLEKIAKNRGVIGSTGLSDRNFLEIDRAKSITDAWILDLKSGERIKISTANSQTNKVEYTPAGGTKGTYATFGKDTTSELQTAFNHIGSNAETSIYGYVGDQFYSVGKVAGAEAMKKLEATPNAQYKGKALLKADPTKAGEGKHSDLVADVVVNLNLTQNKLSGNFDKFATYQRGDATVEAKAVNAADNANNVSDDLKAALKSPVTFNASIKGNKFATGADDKSQASVYGYFYGENAREVGGLVELKDVFHGSFGGEIK